jgi:hypothetical protein
VVETLLGYLLGALDADDVEQLASLLETDPELQRQLDLLRLALEPLELCRREAIDAPADLAVRTWVVIREVSTTDRST